MAEPTEVALCFGAFKLFAEQRLLLEDERRLNVGSRALDILIALVERAGETVGRRELISIVWPHAIVEEGALRVHIAALRKALGHGQDGAHYIVNVPGRGYSFVAEVTRVPHAKPAPAQPGARQQQDRLPARLGRIVGRRATIELLGTQLARRRSATLVGLGGIGKTTVALTAAHQFAPEYPDGVYFADLTVASGRDAAGAIVAAALGLREEPGTLVPRIIALLRDRRALLVVDGCEHVTDVIAPIVERLLRGCANLHVLCTSREPLGIEAEWLHHLPPLEVPPRTQSMTRSEAMRFSAFELFVERATASIDSFRVGEQDVELIAEICHRLDGTPLAIELAAPHVDILGLRGLLSQLDRHALHLRHARRDAPARHKTLGDVLGWSYEQLSLVERQALNRLAIFRSRFTLEAATDLLTSLADSDVPEDGNTLTSIADLTARSWLTTDIRGESVQYQLLQLTRAYASSKLLESGEYGRVASHHARYIHGLVARATEAWVETDLAGWNDRFLWAVDDIRAALAWCFSAEGDVLLGISLTALVAPMVIVFNPYDVSDALDRALTALAALPDKHTDLEVRLRTCWVFEFPQNTGAPAAELQNLALAFAEKSGDAKLIAEALIAMVLQTALLGKYTQCAAHAERLSNAARECGDPLTIVVADRIKAQMEHLAGNHDRARALAERVARNPIPRAPLRTVAAGQDHAVSMRIILCRVLWLKGLPDQAARLAAETRRLALRDSTLTQCHALAQCLCPIHFWRGDIATAQQCAAELRDIVGERRARGLLMPAIASIPWDIMSGPRGGRDADRELPRNVLQLDHLITVDDGLADADAAARAAKDPSWCSAEIMRAHGESLLRCAGVGAATEARRWFAAALDTSGSQRALAWQLRAAVSMARVLRASGETQAARETLGSIYARFTEGFDTSDLVTAAGLLQGMNAANGA